MILNVSVFPRRSNDEKERGNCCSQCQHSEFCQGPHMDAGAARRRDANGK